MTSSKAIACATSVRRSPAPDAGGEPPLDGRHLEAAIDLMHPTTLDWLQRAKNYVEFANQGGRYSDIASFLSRRDVRRLMGSK